MKATAIIKDGELGIRVETSKLSNGKDYISVNIQKSKMFNDGHDEIRLNLDELKAIVKTVELML